MADRPIDLTFMADMDPNEPGLVHKAREFRYIGQDQVMVTPWAFLPVTIAATSWPALGANGASDLYDFTRNLWGTCRLGSDVALKAELKKTCKGIAVLEPYLHTEYQWTESKEVEGDEAWEQDEAKLEAAGQ
jgi:hypothetical protein